MGGHSCSCATNHTYACTTLCETCQETSGANLICQIIYEIRQCNTARASENYVHFRKKLLQPYGGASKSPERELLRPPDSAVATHHVLQATNDLYQPDRRYCSPHGVSLSPKGVPLVPRLILLTFTVPVYHGLRVVGLPVVYRSTMVYQLSLGLPVVYRSTMAYRWSTGLPVVCHSLPVFQWSTSLPWSTSGLPACHWSTDIA